MTALAFEEGVAARAVVDQSPRFFHRLLKRRLALVCVGYLVIVVGVAIIAPIVLPGISRENAGDLLSVRVGPSWHHLLGTDTLGRDVLSRLLVGTRVTLIGVSEALSVVLLLGVPLGLAGGFYGGWTDRLVGWTADLSFSMPAIIIILVVLAVFPESMTAAMVTFGVLAAPALMRVVRSATLPVKQELYIDAARVSGLSRPYIVTRHVLPRVAGPIIVQASFVAAAALLTQSGLAFLNLVVKAPAPSWGGMVADGISAIELQPWLIWPPGVAIAVTVLALGLLGDSVRDATTEVWSAPITRRPGSSRTLPTRGEPSHGAEYTSSALLSVQGLSVSFASASGRVRVVDDVSFEIDAGETLGIVGETGCGKTATALSILRLLPGTGQIDAGRLLFAGRDLAGLSERELRRIRGKKIGFISQEPTVSLNPAFRVGWQLAEAISCHHHVSRREAHGRALDLLRQVHLPAEARVARRYPHELSGGMAQRVAIARALAGEPKLLIADEPTTALDVTVQAEILDLLRELTQDRGMALLLITHDWGVVADICDRAVVMYAGQVVERADVVSMFRFPRHPYTEALLAANPHSAPDAQILPSIPGAVPKPGAWPAGCRFHPRCSYATIACRERPIPLVELEGSRATRCIHYEKMSAT